MAGTSPTTCDSEPTCTWNIWATDRSSSDGKTRASSFRRPRLHRGTVRLVVPCRAPNHDGDVVRAAAVKRVLQQLLAHLLRGGHRRQTLGDALVGDVLREPVRAQQMDVVPIRAKPCDHRYRRVAAE